MWALAIKPTGLTIVAYDYVSLGYHADQLNNSGLWLYVPGLPRWLA